MSAEGPSNLYLALHQAKSSLQTLAKNESVVAEKVLANPIEPIIIPINKENNILCLNIRDTAALSHPEKKRKSPLHWVRRVG